MASLGTRTFRSSTKPSSSLPFAALSLLAFACAGSPTPTATPRPVTADLSHLLVQRADGKLRPKACFDGSPLRPTRRATASVEIVFDCAWKLGSVRTPGGNSLYRVQSETCAVEPTGTDAVATSYEMAPFTESFDVTPLARALGVSTDRICVPSRCVYAVPGQLPICTEDCAADHKTQYVVDRGRCTAADLLRMPPGIDAAFALPTRCTDSPRPGLQAVGDKWRPCACFDGTPLRPSGPANLSLRFDCAWPAGKIPLPNVHAASFRPSDASCHELQNDGAIAEPSLVDEPFVERYEAGEGNALNGLFQHELCVPSRCVFAQPGEPARCSDDCSQDGSTRYTVDRSACR